MTIKKIEDCRREHNAYWRTFVGRWMACRAEVAEEALAERARDEVRTLTCNAAAVWNTLVYFLHAKLTGHKTEIRLDDRRVWFCAKCDADRNQGPKA